VFEEGHDVDALGQHEEPLLEPHEEVLDLAGLGLGLVGLDLPDGEGELFASEAEKNSVTAVPFL
jgi:hypothetical protein